MAVLVKAKKGFSDKYPILLSIRRHVAVLWRMSIPAVVIGFATGTIWFYSHYLDYQKSGDYKRMAMKQEIETSVRATDNVMADQITQRCKADFSKWQAMPAGHDKNAFEFEKKNYWRNHRCGAEVWGIRMNSQCVNDYVSWRAMPAGSQKSEREAYYKNLWHADDCGKFIWGVAPKL